MSKRYPREATCPGCGLVVAADETGRMRGHLRLAFRALRATPGLTPTCPAYGVLVPAAGAGGH